MVLPKLVLQVPKIEAAPQSTKQNFEFEPLHGT
jgi:hypothetical protein